MKYPEHEKMHSVKEKSQAIGEFLEQIQSEGLVICDYHEHEWSPISKGIEQILADYFEIDLNKIEREKRQMLDEMRRTQNAHE